RLGRLWRYRECQPGVPAFGPVLRGEFLVCLHVDVAVHVADRKQKADLRANAGDTRAEAAERSRRAEIVGDLLEVIAGDTELKLLGEKVGGAPVDVEVDAVLVLGISVLEIVGEAGDRREFVAGLRIEVGVAGAVVDRAMAEA